MSKKLKKTKKFDEQKKQFSFDDFISVLPTEKEAEKYAFQSFGFEECSTLQEQAFVSGVDWIRCELERKLKEKITNERA